MKVIKPMALGLLTRPFEHAQRFQLGISVLSFVPLGEAPALFAEVALWKFLAEELAPDQAIDAAIPKACGEFLVTGRAFAQGGVAVPALRVSVRLGERSKSLHVFGDRHWLAGDRPSTPVPFTEMPLNWAHAYGDPAYAENPLGKGQTPTASANGTHLPLANIIDPAHGNAAYRRVAGFGPIDVTWAPRTLLAGTHDNRWLQEDFPGFARDIDWRFFNVAPRDQQFAGPLAGDEPYAIENMHPERPLIEGRLPGIAPRLFLVRHGSEAMEEVPLALTTVWFFPHRLRLVLVHHGRAPLAEEDGADVARVVLGAERLGERREAAHFHSVMQKRLDKERGAFHAMRDRDLVPGEWVVPDPVLAAAEAEAAGEGLALKHARRRQEREIAAQRAYIASIGLDPDTIVPPLPPEEPPPTLDTLPDHVERLLAEAERQKAEAERQRAEDDAAFEARVAGSGINAAEFIARRDAKPKGPPPIADVADQQRKLEAIVADFRAAGLDASGLEAMLADPTMIKLRAEAEAQLRLGYLMSAHFQDPADRMDPARNADLRRALAAGTTPTAPADLTGADLAGLDLTGVDLTDAWLDGADLAGANLACAKLAGAVLAHARLDGCNLDGADLTGANLGRASLVGATLRRAKLNDAVLSYAILDRTVLHEADLTGVTMLETVLRNVDLFGAHAGLVTFLKLDLTGLIAEHAMFDRAQFVECTLTGARLARASFVRAVFLKCPMRGVDFTEATLTKACFVDACDLEAAMFLRATLHEANLRGMRLLRADFTEANLEKADLSRADLNGVRLDRVHARGAQLVAATLAGATLTGANFMQGSLARSDLRGADLTGACLYEADMARVRIDRASRTDRMQTTRMRFLPRYRAPAP